MILEHVTLRDFCLFRGEQTFDLTSLPATRNAGTRGIVLFGGVNGAGKTTLLDAIQLALYGPRARCSKRAVLAYDEFLRKAISERAAKDEFAQDDRQRMTRIAVKTRLVMKDFLKQATERKIDRLSDLITESFRYLSRKQTMVERIHIDPATFAITLYNESGHALSKERLSEGEKQIFAISVLWGLSRASAHPLPAIIDTPMARLDAAPRRHLVERYFPHASHQVLILSTDTEVDRQYYQALQPHIAPAYHLRYDEQSRATHGEEGYFWEETPGGSDSRSGA
jgi:DNA repair exonuclease SbcCD ATPase subunit